MEGCVLATIICFIINPLDFLYLLFQINNNQNRKPNFCISKAPIKYVMAGGRGVMIGCGIITALYVIGVIVGLCLGYGWSSLLLPFLPFIVIGFIGYIWEMFKKFYNLGYDEKRRI